MELAVRYAVFESAHKAALSKQVAFRAGAEQFIRNLIATSMPFDPALVECHVGSKNDRPSSDELELLTRDLFSFSGMAFSAGEVACLRAETRFDAPTETFQLRNRSGALTVEPYDVPEAAGLDWFIRGPRCPSCGVFPEMTSEYLPCRLCDYADYDSDVETACHRFLQAPETPTLVAAVRRLFGLLESEPPGARATYLRYRVSALADVPKSALDPIPWCERPSRER